MVAAKKYKISNPNERKQNAIQQQCSQAVKLLPEGFATEQTASATKRLES